MELHRCVPITMTARGVEGLQLHTASAVGSVGTNVPVQARSAAGVSLRMGRASLVLLLAAGFVTSAAADPKAPFWTAPESCPTAEQARAAVAARAKVSLDGVRVVVTKNEKTFIAQIHAGSTFFRTLTDRDCTSITTAVALVIARNWTEISSLVDQARPRIAKVKTRSAIDAAMEAAHNEAEAPVSPVEITTHASTDAGIAFTALDAADAPVPARAPITWLESAPYRPSYERQPAGPWGGGIGVIGLTGVGALPGVNVGYELSALVRHDTRFVSAAVSRWSASGTTPNDLNVDAIVIRAGWSPRDRPLRAWGLGQVEHYRNADMSVEAFSDGAAWCALGAGFGVAWPMSDYARFVGSFEVAVPLSRNIAMSSGNEPSTSRPIAAHTSFGLEVGWR